MATIRRQGGYVAAFLLGFTFMPAGFMALSSRPIIGVVLMLSGLALMVQSFACLM